MKGPDREYSPTRRFTSRKTALRRGCRSSLISCGPAVSPPSNHDSGNIYFPATRYTQTGMSLSSNTIRSPANIMTFVNDIRSVSTTAGNWLSTENQQKVHNRLIRGADGALYFATHDNSWGTLTDHRGTHIYALKNGVITDLSKTATNYLNAAMQTVNGSIGVHVENYGTIGMEMTRGMPQASLRRNLWRRLSVPAEPRDGRHQDDCTHGQRIRGRHHPQFRGGYERKRLCSHARRL